MGKRHKHSQMKQQNQQEQHQAGGTIIRQLKEIPGCMTCVLAHRTASSTSEFSWTGGTLNAIWPEVLAFFKWTYDTMKSESQVRLYVNVQTKEWKAWAYPQKARTGMTAHEINEGEEGYALTQEQMAQFPGETWYYWGTVHHHCNCSAFQSGVDTHNEHDQDGVHITVGNLGSPRFDIHFRLYVGKFKLSSITVDKFWDVGDIQSGLPDHIKELLPADAKEKLAKRQMGEPPAADQTFPEIWKTNVIDTRPPPPPVSAPVTGPKSPEQTILQLGNDAVKTFVRPYSLRAKSNFEWDLKKGAGELIQLIRHPAFSTNDIEVVADILQTLSNTLDDEMLDILDVLSRNDVTPENMFKWLDKIIKDMKQKELEEDLAKQEVEGGQQQSSNWRGPATTAQVLGTTNVHGSDTGKPPMHNTPPHWTDELNGA